MKLLKPDRWWSLRLNQTVCGLIFNENRERAFFGLPQVSYSHVANRSRREYERLGKAQ